MALRDKTPRSDRSRRIGCRGPFEALEPFQFLTAARPFGWIPFLTLIDGSIWIAVPSLMGKFALYGTLVWSLARPGLRWTSATPLTAVFVFLVHRPDSSLY